MTTTNRPDGFDEATWERLTTKQRQHIVGIIDSDPQTLLEGEQMSPLAQSVYTQCWLAMKRTLFADGILTSTITLDQMDALEQFCLTGIIQSLHAEAQKIVAGGN